mgnify:CR=1 FL=1
MGQAKSRGSFEQRKAEAVAKREASAREQAARTKATAKRSVVNVVDDDALLGLFYRSVARARR